MEDPAMKKISDLTPYTQTLPYASEIFGVYQPMLGWRSKKIKSRIQKGHRNDVSRIYRAISGKLKGRFRVDLHEDRRIRRIRSIEPATLGDPKREIPGSYVLDSIRQKLPPIEDYKDEIWDELINAEDLKRTLNTDVLNNTMTWYQTHRPRGEEGTANRMVAQQLNRESTVAGYLLYLKENQQTSELKHLFYKLDRNLLHLLQYLTYQDPLEAFDPHNDIGRVSLSPLGIVHLFRQYFFEFDTFLGPPVGHVWLSPGASVELLEISTRKTVTERYVESTIETTQKREKSLTEEDELSDAVKEANRSETKFGMNSTVNQGWIGGSASASASIDLTTTQDRSREVAHRHMRQQSEKLSTEIRRNYKSTFKTVTEVTDTSSKRYLLNNTTPDLINYELRRKMRQVGVQVQDIGTYLCWQTYVDDPGRQLGIAKLVHVAKPPDLGQVPPPDTIPMPELIVTEKQVHIPFVPMTEDTSQDDMDENYRYGKEVNTDFSEGERERIKYKFGPYKIVCDQPGYEFAGIDIDPQGNDVQVRIYDDSESPKGTFQFRIKLRHVNFRNVSPIYVTAKVTWRPTEDHLAEIEAKNLEKTEAFNQETQREFEKAFVEAARERINMASNVEPRKFEDLREEERVVVYRMLIQDMLTKNIPMPDDRTHHVISELLNTIFDIDKMLYFVAPEWWRPRLHRSRQWLGGIREPIGGDGGTGEAPSGSPSTIHSQMSQVAQHNILKGFSNLSPMEDKQISSLDTVGWGGVNENRADNYYITEESRPAKFGSSLGWLLQLDGDNLRNAFLNSPWVKAVIPIRPGKEKAALNWLQQVNVEGTEGLDDDYLAPPEQLAEIPHSGPKVTINDAVQHLAEQVAKKHEASLEVGQYPDSEIDDDTKVSATPIDKVYEHGFYSLQGGFKNRSGKEHFEVFDQWVEILPTDQVVPVEVKYDPKTGRQV
jgi:hypothetical protein